MDFLQRKMFQDDMVQYKIYLLDHNSSDQTEERYKELVGQILVNIAPLLKDYIWQNQAFNLKYQPAKGDIPAHVGGITQFGDNVEDEWFIIYLLQQISKTFSNLAISVEDNDGEFLLIEVAEYLPKWLNPETSENRVFLFRGNLHIVPCPSKSSSVGFPRDVVPSVPQALSLLSTHPDACRANPNICSTLRQRLAGYPEKIKSDLHRALCFVPAAIATVLKHRPDLIAPAVSAFYLRDPVDLQACRTFKMFPPDTRVLTMVKFTRCLYAQLQQQQFTPDRRSGFDLPPRSHPQYRAHELGMKLAHGFEILCSKCRLPSSEPNASITCHPQWKFFLESLKKKDYFKEELEGSAHYKELLHSAEDFFKQSVAPELRVPSLGDEVLQVLSSCGPVDLEELKKLESQLPQEDSDSWLDISAQDLEKLLEERSRGRVGAEGKNSSSDKQTHSSGNAVKSKKKTQDVEKEEEDKAGYSLVAVSQKMKRFFNTMSSYEGAEVPWNSTVQSFKFDPDSMVSALDRLLENKENESLDSDDLDDDDYDNDTDGNEEGVETISGGEDCACASGTEPLGSLKSYMDQMDDELMSTNVGQSFSQTTHNKKGLDNGTANSCTMDEAEESEEIQPLDLDVNLVANLLESLSSQEGLAGPASNLLHSLGIQLPANSDPS